MRTKQLELDLDGSEEELNDDDREAEFNDDDLPLFYHPFHRDILKLSVQHNLSITDRNTYDYIALNYSVLRAQSHPIQTKDIADFSARPTEERIRPTMRGNDFSCVGYIDTRLEPEFELRDGREIESISFELITEDNLRFECQTDDRQIAWRKLQRIDPARLYRCKGYFQRIDGHQVFIVEDLNLSTSVPSGTGPRLEVEVKAEKRAQPLRPIAELERRAEADTRNLTKVECEALLEHYPERDIRHYALALYMSRRFKMPIPIAENWVECRERHIFSVGTEGMLFRNRKTYCQDCGRDVTVTLTPKPERTKEQQAHDAERASEALERLKTHGWKAED